MNNLSWLIYAADVSEKVSSAFGLIATFVGVMGGIGIIVLWAAVILEKEPKSPAIYATAIWFFIMVVSLPLSLLTPSSKTIYMIAASEAGETIVTSPEAREIFDDLKEVIKLKLKQELK